MTTAQIKSFLNNLASSVHEAGGYGTSASAAKSPWVQHVRDYAAENNMTYRAALKDPGTRDAYYQNQGKAVPPKPGKRPKAYRKYGDEYKAMSAAEKKAWRRKMKKTNPRADTGKWRDTSHLDAYKFTKKDESEKKKKPSKKKPPKKQQVGPQQPHWKQTWPDIDFMDIDDLRALENKLLDKVAEIHGPMNGMNAAQQQKWLEGKGTKTQTAFRNRNPSADRSELIETWQDQISQIHKLKEARLDALPHELDEKHGHENVDMDIEPLAMPDFAPGSVDEDKDIELKQALANAPPARGKKRKGNPGAGDDVKGLIPDALPPPRNKRQHVQVSDDIWNGMNETGQEKFLAQYEAMENLGFNMQQVTEQLEKAYRNMGSPAGFTWASLRRAFNKISTHKIKGSGFSKRRRLM